MRFVEIPSVARFFYYSKSADYADPNFVNYLELHNVELSAIDLRASYRIKEQGGAGELVLLSVLNRDRILVDEITPLTRSGEQVLPVGGTFVTRYNLDSSSLQILPPLVKTLGDYLPAEYQSAELMPKLLQFYEEEILDVVNNLADKLLDLRHFSAVEDQYLKALVSYLGLDLDLELSSEELRKLLLELLYFYRISGTQDYSAFIGYITNSLLRMENMYTADYSSFSTTPAEGSYLTNRVQITYDPSRFNTSTRSITKFFYKIAPIHDVLQQVSGQVRLSSSLGLIPISSSQVNSVGVADLTPGLQIYGGASSELATLGFSDQIT